MVEPKFTFRAFHLPSMLFLLFHDTTIEALQCMQQVLFPLALKYTPKAFFFLAEVLLLFSRNWKVIFRCWEIALWASWLTPFQGAAVELCFLRLDNCHLRLCEVCKGHQLCLGTFVGGDDPRQVLCPLILVDY